MFFNVDGGCSRISVSTSQGARRRCFLALMVDAPGSTALAPPRGPPLTFLSVDSERSWISSSDTSQGVRHLRFLALMVGAPGSPAPTPPRGSAVDVF
jgi:hypothetical protein